MSDGTGYRRSMSWWFLRSPAFVRYMLREATALCVLWFAIVLLAATVTLGYGETAYTRFLEVLTHPALVAVHGLVFVACVYNSITWFLVSPKATPELYIGGRALPAWMIVAGQFVMWAMLSVLVVAATVLTT